MGFFHPPLLNLAKHPKGNDNTRISIRATYGVNGKLKLVCSKRLMVEKARSRNMPFSQKPTCQPRVLYSTLMIKMFKTPMING